MKLTKDILTSMVLQEIKKNSGDSKKNFLRQQIRKMISEADDVTKVKGSLGTVLKKVAGNLGITDNATIAKLSLAVKKSLTDDNLDLEEKDAIVNVFMKMMLADSIDKQEIFNALRTVAKEDSKIEPKIT
jgi:hypothetical protein